MEQSKEEKKWAPPYVSYKTFLNFLERLRDLAPDEHRPLGLLDLPPHPLEAVHEHVAPLPILFHRLTHATLIFVQRDDGRNLNGLEDSVIEIAFQS